MTNQQQPPEQERPTWGPAPAGPRPRWYRRRGCLVALGAAVLAVLLGLGALGALVSAIDKAASGGGTPKATVTTKTTKGTTGPAETTSPAAASGYPTPKPGDFHLRVKVVKKECFGSAGGLVTYRIEAGWGETYDPDKTYDVTYVVRGGEDGPVTNTFQVTGDQYQREQEENIGTPTCGAHLTARATEVEEA